MLQRTFSGDSQSSYSEATPIVNRIDQELPVNSIFKQLPSLIEITYVFPLKIAIQRIQ